MKMKMKKTIFALLSASVAASAASVWENQQNLESKVDSINAKRGLEVGGSIRAVAQKSTFDTDNDPKAVNRMQETERNEYVTADLDFHFRPYENVRANATMRLGGGMQEYFSSASKTLSVAWINVEGNIGNSFYWIVGDFRQQYSPLTLYTPGIDVMYEPTIFARKRHMAMKEQMIEGNQRNLQGANVQFRGNLGEAAGELRVEALLARLNRTTVLDFSGAEGNIIPNAGFAGATQAANMDKWLVAGNIELLPLSRNVYVGVTPMYIFDNQNSFTYTYRHPSEEEIDNDVDGVLDEEAYYLKPVNPYDLDPQKTMVISGRIGADVAGIMGSKNLVLDLVGEYAMSSDEIKKHDIVVDEATGDFAFVENSETLNGSAILAQLNVGYKTSSFGANLGVDFVRNDSAWFNNLAQSPSFFAQRILNSDKDGKTVRYGVYSPLYSTFDAMYNYSPKFAPSPVSMKTDDNGFKAGQTESYNIAPYNKNSWGTNVYSHAQLALLQSLTDPSIQLALPNGLATANRQGVQAILKLSYSEWAEMQGLFNMFNQLAATPGFKEAAYTEYGGGAKVNVFKALGFTLPLEISGSYKHSERSMDLEVGGTAELKTDFINAGLYLQYLPRLGLTAGFQYITTEYNAFEGMLSTMTAPATIVPLVKGEQMQWMVGLDYSLADNTWLSLNFGIASVSNEYNTALDPEGSAGAVNLPDYYDAATVGNYKHEFTQTVLEASINVEF